MSRYLVIPANTDQFPPPPPYVIVGDDSLRLMQRAVAAPGQEYGLIERVADGILPGVADPCELWCNEEFLYVFTDPETGDPAAEHRNSYAKALAAALRGDTVLAGTAIFGPVVVTGAVDDEGQTLDVPDSVIAKCLNSYEHAVALARLLREVGLLG